MALDKDDYKMSMAISRRGKNDEPDELRSLLVHRLSDTAKAVIRRSLTRGNTLSGFCEPCMRWTGRTAIDETFRCPYCERRYRVELLIFEEIEDD